MSYDWPLILTFHHVHESDSSRYVVSVRRFTRLLDRLEREGFSAITLAEALASGPAGDGTAAPRTYTITFDDALESFGRLALPVLVERGLAEKTALFVPTGMVGGRNSWSDEPTTLQRLMPWHEVDEAIMGWDAIAEAAETGVSIESHGHEHIKMDRSSYDQVLADARASRDALLAHGYDSRLFCLPYGWHSPDAKRAIAEAGFEAAFSVKWGGTDRYDIRRIPVYGTDSAITTRLKLSGRYFDAFDLAARLAGKKRYRR